MKYLVMNEMGVCITVTYCADEAIECMFLGYDVVSIPF